jgi:hypothetical protein
MSVGRHTPALWNQLDLLGRKIYPTSPFYGGEDWLKEVAGNLEDEDIVRT